MSHPTDLAYREEMIRLETEARERFRLAVVELVDAVKAYPYLWHIGDGAGGGVLSDIEAEFEAGGFSTTRWEPPSRPVKRQLPAKVRAIVLARDGLRCVRCGENAVEVLSVDHILAVANGGGDELENLQTLCRPCNSKKGTR
jgi:hypothetical protein